MMQIQFYQEMLVQENDEKMKNTSTDMLSLLFFSALFSGDPETMKKLVKTVKTLKINKLLI